MPLRLCFLSLSETEDLPLLDFSELTKELETATPDPILPHDAIAPPKQADAWRVSGDSELGEVIEYLHYDEQEKKFTLERVQDVEPVLENAKRMSREGGSDAGKNKAGDFYLAARVPLIIIEAWLNIRGLAMRDFKGKVVNEFLNDANHSAFRVWPGRV